MCQLRCVAALVIPFFVLNFLERTVTVVLFNKTNCKEKRGQANGEAKKKKKDANFESSLIFLEGKEKNGGGRSLYVVAQRKHEKVSLQQSSTDISNGRV
jgi:hypothetical protein